MAGWAASPRHLHSVQGNSSAEPNELGREVGWFSSCPPLD